METKVSDLQLAAYLLALECELLRVEGPSGRRVFVFKEVPGHVTLEYYQGVQNVSARKLFNCYRDLKGLCVQAL